MSHLSLYRKYRSQSFADLIGQDHVVRTLQNAVASGKIAHSYLFTGPRGTGKTSSARLLAKCLNCETGPTPEPCNQCEACLSITQGNCVDVYEIDAASESGVENVRETIVEAVPYAPNFCRYRVFIIDEVHDLSPKAFDALLKTIEEPPAHIIFILATTEYNRVPPTIRSRCQKYEFHRASIAHLVDRLTFVAGAEEVEVEPAALMAIARMADGGFRDALTLLEQAILTREGVITLQNVYDQLGLVSEETIDGLLLAIRHADVPKIVDLLAGIARQGRDPLAVLDSMMYRLADLTRAAYRVDLGASGDSTQEAALSDVAAKLGRENLLELRGMIAQAHRHIRDVSLPRLWLEAEMIRAASQLNRPEPVAYAVTAQPEAQPTPKPKAPPPKPATKKEEPTSPPPSDPWKRVVADLTNFSRALGMRLAFSRLEGIEGKVATIELPTKGEYEWITEGKGSREKQAKILELVRAQFGPEVEVEFTFKNGAGHAAPEPEAVELPMDGEALYKAAAERFKPE